MNDQYIYNFQANFDSQSMYIAQDFSERLNLATKLRDHICVLAIRLKLLCDEVEPHRGNYSKINNANIMKLFLMIHFFPQ